MIASIKVKSNELPHPMRQLSLFKVQAIKVAKHGDELCKGWELVKAQSEGVIRCKAGMRVACAYHAGTVAASVGVYPA